MLIKIIIYLKLPVRSDTLGLNNNWVTKLAPRLTNFLLKSHPLTPPSPIYRDPVTISKFCWACFFIKSGINFG